MDDSDHIFDDFVVCTRLSGAGIRSWFVQRTVTAHKPFQCQALGHTPPCPYIREIG